MLLQKTALENQLREAKSHDSFEFKIFSESFSKIIKTLKSSIHKIEKQLSNLIETQEEIKKSKDLLTTIPGIGTQCAINFIITNNFKFFENAKHLACYAGVVPFKKSIRNDCKKGTNLEDGSSKAKKTATYVCNGKYKM